MNKAKTIDIQIGVALICTQLWGVAIYVSSSRSSIILPTLAAVSWLVISFIMVSSLKKHYRDR